jgi:hypothetical protein
MYLLFIPFVQFLQLTWDHLFFLIEIYDQLKGEWLLLNANSAISWREQVTFDEMMMMSALYYINMLSWLFIELAHWNNSPQVDMLLHQDTLFWFCATQSLLLLLAAVCLAERQQIINL